jgi:Icc protein
MERRIAGWLGALLGASAILLAVVGLTVRGQPQNDFRFCILGDRTGDAQSGVYERIWHDLNVLHPDFAINTGDTIQGGNDATAEAEWRSVRRVWERYSCPLYFTPGNHDIWSSESRRIYEQETGHPPQYGFDYQNSHFTVLDNSQTEDLSPSQMEFLDHDLVTHRDRDPKFVFFHKPFWLIPVAFQSRQFPFHQLVKKYGVQYVISGHGHQFARFFHDGIVYLEAGSSGGKLKGEGFERGWFYGQILARVTGSDVKMKVHEIGGPEGKGRSFTAEEWDRNLTR